MKLTINGVEREVEASPDMKCGRGTTLSSPILSPRRQLDYRLVGGWL